MLGEVSTEHKEFSAIESQALLNTNTTNHDQLLLGKEWAKNALGEHASVASFSTFSIALMTNHAPSYLVEDALKLKAGLDEIRHARTSFKIAQAHWKECWPWSLATIDP